MVSMVDSHLEETMKAYAPLFQPLKDLAKNWTIDIEKCLEGFVEWMKQVQEVERSSGGHFNFAQAALVVAGGAEVYGRKVDYVHQLTLGFFEQLSEKAKKNRKGVADGENDENLHCEVPPIPDDPCEWVDLSKLRSADFKALILKRSACKPARVLPQGAMLLDLINERIVNDFTTKEIVGEITNVINTLRDGDATIENGGFQDDTEVDIKPIGDARPSASQWEVNRATQGTQQGLILENGDATQLLPDDVIPEVEGKGIELFAEGDFERFENEDDEDDVEMEDLPPPHPADVEGFVDVDVDEVDIFQEYNFRVVPHKVIKSFSLASSIIQRQRKKMVALGLNPEILFMDYLHNEVYRKGIKKTYQRIDIGFNDMPLVAVSEFIDKEQKRRNALKSARSRQNKVNSNKLDVEEAALPQEEDFDDVPEAFEDVVSEPEFAKDEAEEKNRFDEVIDNEDMDSNFRDVMYADPDIDDSIVPGEEMSFSTRLRHYLNLYWAEGEEIHSKLDERVQKWDESVTPLLEDEEKRRIFNIHDYGSELLGKFDDLGEQYGFFDLIQEVPDYDVSRYFLSSLMLANTYNLEIIYDAKEFQGKKVGELYLGENYRLKLLKRDRHHEAIEQSVNS